MARGVNKVILIGRVGKDPDCNYTQGGLAVVKFSIATSEAWTDKATSEKKEKTEWHRIVGFGKLAEICGEYLKKGAQVYVAGKLQTRSWDQEGVTRYMTEIVMDEMQMLDSKPKTESGGYGASENYQQGHPDAQQDDIPF